MNPLFQIQVSGDVPLVQQIQNGLREKIRTSALTSGTRLPSMRQMSDDMGVSLGVVKQAINTLTAEGYLRSEPREGVFVVGPQLQLRDVVLVLPSLQLEQMGRIIRGARAGLVGTSYRLIIQAADTDFDDQMHLLSYLDKDFVAGVLMCPPGLASYVEPIRKLIESGVVCVQATNYLDGVGSDAVSVDGLEMGRIAFDYLLSRGHRNIAVVDSTSDDRASVDIRAGADRVLHHYGLQYDALPRVKTSAGDLDAEHPWARGQEAAAELLARYPNTTAMIGINQHLALGVYRAIKAAGKRLPDDISLVGIGSDLTVFSMTEPGITIVDDPLEKITERAAYRLRDIIEGRSGEPVTVHLAPTLIERGSVRAIKS